MINVALFGNPNVGKTTVFNLLTGSNQYVGNWPGVTIDKKEGFLGKDIKIVDLPVPLVPSSAIYMYSFTTYKPAS